MKYNDPFLGTVNLTKVGQQGVDVIYEDEKGNYYINVECFDNSAEPHPMVFIRKDTVDKIKSIE